jgi:hypothetical protein
MIQIGDLKKLRRKLNLRLLRNHIGIWYNFLHFLYSRLGRLNYSVAQNTFSEAGRMAQEIEQNGFFVLPPDRATIELVARISADADKAFSRGQKVIKTFDEGGMHRLAECLVQLPGLEDFLTQRNITGAISAYFRSHFRVYSCDVYRTFPQKTDSIASFLWHIDNAPRDALKLMIYLTDVNEQNGALSVLPKDKTRLLQLKGLTDRTDAEFFEDEIGKSAHRINGPKGTIIFFAAQYCLHRGSYVKENFRDVATFLLFPSLAPQRVFSEADRLTYSKNFGYLLNPFTGKALRWGDE